MTALALVCAILSCALSGCKSTSPSQYISPRVEGRLLNAETHQPIEGVQIRLVNPGGSIKVQDTRKGGQIMMQPRLVTTGHDGTFAMSSERALSFLRHVEWFSINVAFDHPDYVRLVKMYKFTDATNSPSGEPIVKTGDVLLKPLEK